MQSEIFALDISPFALTITFLVGMFFGAQLEQFLSKLRWKAWRKKNGWRKRKEYGALYTVNKGWSARSDIAASKRFDAADQLRIVMNAKFTVQSLLNKSEARVFKELDRMVIDCNPSWQVMAQVSLGEILRCKDSTAFSCINSKRVDLLLMDEDCRPRHAIEYQGGAHYQKAAAARDAVKKRSVAACRHWLSRGRCRPDHAVRAPAIG